MTQTFAVGIPTAFPHASEYLSVRRWRWVTVRGWVLKLLAQTCCSVTPIKTARAALQRVKETPSSQSEDVDRLFSSGHLESVRLSQPLIFILIYQHPLRSCRTTFTLTHTRTHSPQVRVKHRSSGSVLLQSDLHLISVWAQLSVCKLLLCDGFLYVHDEILDYWRVDKKLFYLQFLGTSPRTQPPPPAVK